MQLITTLKSIIMSIEAILNFAQALIILLLLLCDVSTFSFFTKNKFIILKAVREIL